VRRLGQRTDRTLPLGRCRVVVDMVPYSAWWGGRRSRGDFGIFHLAFLIILGDNIGRLILQGIAGVVLGVHARIRTWQMLVEYWRDRNLKLPLDSKRAALTNNTLSTTNLVSFVRREVLVLVVPTTTTEARSQRARARTVCF
jgi:hypothetical protein